MSTLLNILIVEDSEDDARLLSSELSRANGRLTFMRVDCADEMRKALTDAGYVGLPVHTVARICSAAHGGQILLSAAARNALGQSLPAGVGLRSLGSHRLRGLREPVDLFQVETAALTKRFPPLRTLAAPRGQAGER